MAKNKDNTKAPTKDAKASEAADEKLKEAKQVQAERNSKEEYPEFSFSDAFSALGNFLDRYSWVLLLAASVLLIGYYVLWPSRTVYHSDTTDTLMWAIASYEGKALFNPDFNYACLLPFGTSLIMTALLPIFGVTMTTHVLGMLCFFLLFTAALIWMCRSMDWSWKWTSVMTFAVLLMLSGSEKLREIFWGHTIYYSLGVLFIFAGLAMLFRFMDASAQLQACTDGAASKKCGRKALIYFIVLAVWFVLTGMNQTVSITIFSLPVLAAMFCERWLDTGDKLFCKKNRRTLALFLILAVCMMVGFLITKIAAGDITAGYQSAYSTYSPMNEWVTNLLKFPNQWFTLMGVSINAGEPLFSVHSIQSFIMIIANVVILVLPLLALIFYKKIEDAKFRILILTHWFVTLLIMLAYVCGKLSSANWRLTPIAATAIVVSVAFLRWSIPRISLQRMIPLLMVPVFLTCMINAATIIKMPADGYKNAVLYKLGKALEMNGLDYGYATFWRANSITIMSDSKVECRGVQVDENGIVPGRYQNLNEWFKDQPNQEEYFLLLTVDEKLMLENSGSYVLDMPHEEIQAEGYIIWVFEENIFDE